MLVQLAGCIITDDKNRILLIHRNTAQFKHWELPGGKVEEGEDEAQAAKRELMEELGAKVEIINELGRTTFQDKNGKFAYVWFKAEITHGQPTIKEPEKFDQSAYFSLKQMTALPLSGNMRQLLRDLQNGKVVIPLQKIV